MYYAALTTGPPVDQSSLEDTVVDWLEDHSQ